MKAPSTDRPILDVAAVLKAVDAMCALTPGMTREQENQIIYGTERPFDTVTVPKSR